MDLTLPNTAQNPGYARTLELARFGLSGGIATLSHWGVMALFLAFGVTPVLASSAGAIVGALSNYLLQYHVTFFSNKSHVDVAPKYLFVVVCSWVLNAALLFLQIRYLNLDVVAAQVSTTLIITILNYLGYRYVVFR